MKEQRKITISQKQALAVATMVALAFGAYFLRGFFTIIVFAAIMAFMFNPLYLMRLHKNGKPGSAAAQTLIVAAIVILVPLALLVTLTGLQINQFVQEVSSNTGQIDFPALTQGFIDQINQVISRTPTDFRVTPEWLQTTSVSLVETIGGPVLDILSNYIGSLFNFFSSAMIFIFVFLSLLKNQKSLRKTIRQINPLGGEISDLYMNRISSMTKAMVLGQFVIAIAQGFTDAALIYVAGFHEAFLVLFIVLTALSFIPLGGGILAIPIGIIMMLTGNWLGGVLVIVGHLLIVTNIDNILRPQLVPKEAKLDSALLVLSVFAGIAFFGFLGIIVGPVIMITIVTTIKVYLEVYRYTENNPLVPTDPLA